MRRLPLILIVDDDEDHVFVVRRAIERADLPVQVVVAADGEEALFLLGLKTGESETKSPLSVAAVLLDLRLPGVTGLEVLRRMRGDERTRLVPVVVVSSSSRPEDVLQSYDLGANSYVVKRFDGGQAGSYLAEIVRYWGGLNEGPLGQPEGTAST
jgi:CheY-like chemotaxis protein